MSFILGNEYFVIPLFAASVFLISYMNSEKILEFLHRKSLGNRELVIRTLDMMFVEVDKKKVTNTMLFGSFGLGLLVFLAFWPSIIPGIMFGTTITILGWSLPKIVVNYLWDKRCSRLVYQMVDGMTIMANGIRAGLSITQSMERVVNNMKGPLPQEFNLCLNKVRLGMSVEEALNEFGQRIPRQDVQMFVTAVNILKETGGNLAETFTTVVTTIRERQKVENKIEAMTAQGIMQGVIITLVPFILMIIFLVLDPAYVMPLFTRPLGWMVLFVMLTLQVIGGVMIKKIVTIKV